LNPAFLHSPLSSFYLYKTTAIMKDLPEHIHLQIISLLQFSHMWNVSLVCKQFHTLLHTKGICDGVYEQRWNHKRTDTTLHDYIEKGMKKQGKEGRNQKE
jgi:hypothetical protein